MSGKRTDQNHAACRAALRAIGWHVEDTSHVGKGWFDLVAVHAGRIVLIEVKDGSLPPSRRRLTPDEARVHAGFIAAGADVYVWEDASDLSYFVRPRKYGFSYDELQMMSKEQRAQLR